MRPTAKTVIVTAVACVALALSGVAAGANQSASPQKWVGVFCGSLVTWEQAVKSQTGKLKTEINKLKTGGSVKLSSAKSELVGYMGKLVGSTNTMLGKLRGVGSPNVPNGSKLQAALLKGLGTIQTAFKSGQTAAKSLPTNSRTAFSSAANRIGTAISTSGNQAQSALAGLSRYDSQALENAFKADKTCSKIGG